MTITKMIQKVVK